MVGVGPVVCVELIHTFWSAFLPFLVGISHMHEATLRRACVLLPNFLF